MIEPEWTAIVERIDPERDVLIVKCEQVISRRQADDIRAEVARRLPDIRVLIMSKEFDHEVIRGGSTPGRPGRHRRMGP